MDNLDDFHVLQAIAETNSLTAAAKRCGLSTASVSAALKRLEAALGIRLFERTTRSIRPTAEGEVMIDHARRALQLLAEGQALARAGSANAGGTVRITAATALASLVLAPWIAAFAEKNRGVRVELLVSDAVVDLVREGIDLAVRNGPLPDSNLVAKLLSPACRIACASPSYLAAHGVPAHPSELAQHECITYLVGGRRLDTWSFDAPGGGPGLHCEVRVSGALTTDNAAIANQWALRGRGVIYQSALYVQDALARGDLVRLFPDLVGQSAPLYAVLPSGRYVPNRVRTLIDAFAAFLAERNGGAAGTPQPL